MKPQDRRRSPGKSMSGEQYVEFQGLKLPPHQMRLGSMPKKADETYVNYAKGSARLLEEYANAGPETRIVDIGCGPGRLLIGVQARWGQVAGYHGIDVDHEAIEWADKHLSDPPAITFHHIDIRSDRYNPAGEALTRDFALPVEDGRADIVVLLSVFSHMFLGEIERYLTEIRRMLAPKGQVVLTLFVEDNVPAEEENPDGYLAQWRGPVHCVRINRSDFEARLAATGLKVTGFVHRKMQSGQSLYVLSARDS